MIKAIIAGSDRNLALALEEFGGRTGVEINTENVIVPYGIYCETTNFFDAFSYATAYACAAIDAAPDADIFIGRQSVLRRTYGSWRHLISIQIVDRHQVLLCGTWTEPVSVPRNLIDEVRSRGMTTNSLERLLAERYTQDGIDPYCWVSRGRTRQQLIVEALLKAPDRRWLARF
jgi:hypothetical protein